MPQAAPRSQWNGVEMVSISTDWPGGGGMLRGLG
jgi:hypothetical protein